MSLAFFKKDDVAILVNPQLSLPLTGEHKTRIFARRAVVGVWGKFRATRWMARVGMSSTRRLVSANCRLHEGPG